MLKFSFHSIPLVIHQFLLSCYLEGYILVKVIICFFFIHFSLPLLWIEKILTFTCFLGIFIFIYVHCSSPLWLIVRTFNWILKESIVYGIISIDKHTDSSILINFAVIAYYLHQVTMKNTVFATLVHAVDKIWQLHDIFCCFKMYVELKM